MPDIARNTGGFNYRRYLNSQKIFGSIFVKDYYISDVGKFNLIYWIQDEINNSFKKLFPKNEMGLIIGMMIGDTKDISEDVLDSFKDTGITHLVAVSGSNVMYVLSLVQFLFQKICGKRKTYYISIVFIVIFMLVSGASSSVVRATIMVILMIFANIFYRKSDIVSNIAFAGFILMIYNPLVVYDVGFILSFGGTVGIVLLSKNIEMYFESFKKLKETLAVTCSAQLVLIPIMAYYFNTISTISIITNIIVVPISGIITVLGFIVFIISKISFQLASILSNALYTLAHFTIVISKIFSQIPFSNLKVITPNLFEVVLFYFAIFVITNKIKLPFLNKASGKFINGKRKSPDKFLFCVISIFIIFELCFYFCPKNYVQVNFIDVGQGDATFIKTNLNKNILIDGGGSKTYDVGKNILMPYLLDNRVMFIDSIFCSHSDEDHLNGVLTAVEYFRVDKVFIAKNSLGYEALYDICKKRNTKIIELKVGDEIKIDDVSFSVIGPNLLIKNDDVNAYSLVIKMRYKDKSVLFTGDINQDSELKLQNVKADILKVAHHGSNTSSNRKFIAKVNPQISVIQVGKNNKYGHPSKEVLEILKKYSKIYTTAIYGEIKFKIGKEISIQRMCEF